VAGEPTRSPVAGAVPSGRPDGRRPQRIEREERTLAAMIVMYCRDRHRPSAVSTASSGSRSATLADPGTDLHGARPATGAGRLCPDCAELLAYSGARLARCPYGAGKPTCTKCPTHCYGRAQREQVRAVMRYSGPRMLREHPLLAASHLIDGRRKPPAR
jgi:hypothetical protein